MIGVVSVMAHHLTIAGLAMIVALFATNCASLQRTPEDDQNALHRRYAAILATNDPALHPRIVRLVRLTGDDTGDITAEGRNIPGFLLEILAPDSERGRTLWRHYCGEPDGFERVVQPTKT